MNQPSGMMQDAGPRVLLLSMYPLDRGLWGATTRITRLRDALAQRVRLDVISGTRSRRAAAMLRYALRGGMRGLSGIYVENSTALPGPVDIAFLASARAMGIPVLTYIRDAQQLFAEYYEARSLKRRLSRALFRPATNAWSARPRRWRFRRVAWPWRCLASNAVPTPCCFRPAHVWPRHRRWTRWHASCCSLVRCATQPTAATC